MSREKQIIEEMAYDICVDRKANFADGCRVCSHHENRCLYQDIACSLYNKDYRKQEWISVEERLPEKYGDVICYTSNGSILQLPYNPKYRLFNVSFDNVEHAMNVDYWMPLPEPPKMKGGAV